MARTSYNLANMTSEDMPNAMDPNSPADDVPQQSALSAEPSKASSNLNPRSCVTCRRRKVRCNKHNPCSNCVRAGIECIFPAPGRAPRRSRKPPEAELLARLKKLEAVVHSLGAQVDENGGLLQSPGANGHGVGQGDSSPETTAGIKRSSVDRRLGRLVIDEDRSRYVSNQFWASMGDEVRAAASSPDLRTTDFGRSLRCETFSTHPVQMRRTTSTSRQLTTSSTVTKALSLAIHHSKWT
jgi:hypothetical protein